MRARARSLRVTPSPPTPKPSGRPAHWLTGRGAARQTVIHAEGFRSLAEGETVEFEIQTDDSGRTRAVDVTGPNGAYVQGAPRPDRRDRDDHDDDW